MPSHYGMSFGEMGRGASQAQIDRHMANVFADPGPSQDEIDRANRENAAIAATVRMEQQAAADRAAAAAAAQVQANIEAAAEARARRAAQAQAMTVGTPAMGFTEAQMASGPGAMFARYGPAAPAVMEAVSRPSFGGLTTGLLGALGQKTMQEHLRTGTGQPVMDASGRVRGALSAGPFGGTVYSGMPIPEYEGPYSNLIAPQPEADEPTVTATVTDPATGQQRCPDGYIFDPDLNACRLDTRAGAMPSEPVGAGYARMGLLDAPPEGLLEFQQRYGAGFGTPSDFEAANLAFRRQAATYPEYFQASPKLDGYTLLS